MSLETAAPLHKVCRWLDAPRSTVYHRRGRAVCDHSSPVRPGPSPVIDDEDLLALIRKVIADSEFTGEGYRKVWAKLRSDHRVFVGRKRVLRLMREHGLLAPVRDRGGRRAHLHDGTIIPKTPNSIVGTDATMAYTFDDGWVWVFVATDHFTGEGFTSAAKRGDRFAALEPIHDLVVDRFGCLAPDLARGILLRHDHGPQYTSDHFQGSIRWLGFTDSPSFVREPETNGCAERFIRTLKEQLLWTKAWCSLAELQAALAEFIQRYNTRWILERHGYQSPRTVYLEWLQAAEQAA